MCEFLLSTEICPTMSKRQILTIDGNLQRYAQKEREMTNIYCFQQDCNKHKCVIDQTFVIVPENKKYAFAFMKTAHCPICKRSYTLITNFRFIKEGVDKQKRAFGCFTPIHKLFAGKEAERIFENIYEEQKAVLYEVLKNQSNVKSGFYLNYSEYGIVKRCYSNLSTLKLGRIKYNFEDLKKNTLLFT